MARDDVVSRVRLLGLGRGADGNWGRGENLDRSGESGVVLGEGLVGNEAGV